MSVNTYAKIIHTKNKGYEFAVYDADTQYKYEPRYYPTLKEALKAFDEEQKNGWIEYGLSRVDV